MNGVLRHLSNMFDGVGIIFEAPNNKRKYKRVGNGFRQDQSNLRSDVCAIGADIRNKSKEVYER